MDGGRLRGGEMPNLCKVMRNLGTALEVGWKVVRARLEVGAAVVGRSLDSVTSAVVGEVLDGGVTGLILLLILGNRLILVAAYVGASVVVVPASSAVDDGMVVGTVAMG